MHIWPSKTSFHEPGIPLEVDGEAYARRIQVRWAGSMAKEAYGVPKACKADTMPLPII